MPGYRRSMLTGHRSPPQMFNSGAIMCPNKVGLWHMWRQLEQHGRLLQKDLHQLEQRIAALKREEQQRKQGVAMAKLQHEQGQKAETTPVQQQQPQQAQQQLAQGPSKQAQISDSVFRTRPSITPRSLEEIRAEHKEIAVMQCWDRAAEDPLSAPGLPARKQERLGTASQARARFERVKTAWRDLPPERRAELLRMRIADVRGLLARLERVQQRDRDPMLDAKLIGDRAAALRRAAEGLDRLEGGRRCTDFGCRICGDSFLDRQGLADHMLCLHSAQTAVMSVRDNKHRILLFGRNLSFTLAEEEDSPVDGTPLPETQLPLEDYWLVRPRCRDCKIDIVGSYYASSRSKHPQQPVRCPSYSQPLLRCVRRMDPPDPGHRGSPQVLEFSQAAEETLVKGEVLCPSCFHTSEDAARLRSSFSLVRLVADKENIRGAGGELGPIAARLASSPVPAGADRDLGDDDEDKSAQQQEVAQAIAGPQASAESGAAEDTTATFRVADASELIRDDEPVYVLGSEFKLERQMWQLVREQQLGLQPVHEFLLSFEPLGISVYRAARDRACQQIDAAREEFRDRPEAARQLLASFLPPGFDFRSVSSLRRWVRRTGHREAVDSCLRGVGAMVSLREAGCPATEDEAECVAYVSMFVINDSEQSYTTKHAMLEAIGAHYRSGLDKWPTATLSEEVVSSQMQLLFLLRAGFGTLSDCRCSGRLWRRVLSCLSSTPAT